MTAAATREGIIDRIRRDGRTVEALSLVLGCSVNGLKTTAIECLDPGHADRHASAVIEPGNGRVTCRGCGRTWGLLDLAVARGLATDRVGAARRLEELLYAGSVRGTGTATPSRRRNPTPSSLVSGVSVPVPPESASQNEAVDGAARFPFVPDEIVRSLGWRISRHGDKVGLRAPVFDASLQICAIKVRGARKANGKLAAYLEPAGDGRRDSGLLHAEGLADLGPGALALVLAGETDLLGFYEAAAREGTHAVAVSPSNGEGQNLSAVAGAFRGLRVVVVYDADAPGRAGALARIEELRGTAEAVAALALPFAAEQRAAHCKDVRDWLANGGTATRLVELAEGALRGEGVVTAVATHSSAVAPSSPDEGESDRLPPPWKPFPSDALPPVIAELVVEGAAAIGCDEAYIALPCLVVAAGAIGNSRSAKVKEGWCEPSVLWGGVIGESGTHKSPAQDIALEPLHARDDQAQREHEEDLKVWRAEKLRHDVHLAAWRRKGAVGAPPAEPERPAGTRYVIVDATTEAVVKLLAENDRGLVLYRDELSGWLRSFDAYRGGFGGDTAFYLQVFGARRHSVDRKTGDSPRIRVPRAALSICGGIQPATLGLCIGREHAEDGLLARMLLAHPPRRVSKWSTATVSAETKLRYADAINALLDLEAGPEKNGARPPVPLPFSDEALTEWIEFYNAFAERQADTVGDEAAALSKIEGCTARFALLHQLVRDPAATEIDIVALRAAVRLALWFADEVVRVYRVLGETEEDAARRRLLEWIGARGGRVTVRELSHGPREYRGTSVAQEALDGLVTAELGLWEELPAGPKGGRPSRVFVLRKGAAESGREGSARPGCAPHPSSPGTGTETSESSLGSGGFRSQQGVVEPEPSPVEHSQ